MKRYPVSVARERLADVLDEAERGIPVAIERRDVRYVIRAEPLTRPRKRRPLIEAVDPSLEDGQWQWNWSPKGAAFRARREPA